MSTRQRQRLSAAELSPVSGTICGWAPAVGSPRPTTLAELAWSGPPPFGPRATRFLRQIWTRASVPSRAPTQIARSPRWRAFFARELATRLSWLSINAVSIRENNRPWGDFALVCSTRVHALSHESAARSLTVAIGSGVQSAKEARSRLAGLLGKRAVASARLAEERDRNYGQGCLGTKTYSQNVGRCAYARCRP